MKMLAFVLALWAAQAGPAPVQWGQWRGPFNTGMARGDAPLPGPIGAASPGRSRFPAAATRRRSSAADRLFLTTAVPTGKGARQRAPGAPAAAPTPAWSIASR